MCIRDSLDTLDYLESDYTLDDMVEGLIAAGKDGVMYRHLPRLRAVEYEEDVYKRQDIVSDLAAGLVGGLGMAPGANIGRDIAIFEATHGSAPDIAGKDIANPTAEILSACMMLDHLGEGAAATRIREAVKKTLAAGESVTGDVRRAQTGSVEGLSLIHI